MNFRNAVLLLFAFLMTVPVPALAQFPPPPLPTYYGTLNVGSSRTMLRDVVGRVVITADNVTLDCNGHTITAASSGGSCGTGSSDCGIIVDGRSNVTLLNCEVIGHGIGIWINESDSVEVYDSIADGNDTGFRAEDSDYVRFESNTAIDSTTEGFALRTLYSADLLYNVSTSNGTDGFDENDCSGTIYIQNSSTYNSINGFENDNGADITYWDNEASNNGQHGISLDAVDTGYIVLNETVDNGSDGLRLDDIAGVGTNYFAVVQNYSEGNGDDAAQQSSACTGNTFTGNTFIGSTPGI